MARSVREIGDYVSAGAKGMSTDAHFFEETLNPQKIRDLLDKTSHHSAVGKAERIQGMKFLIAQVSKGQDVSEFYPFVVKNTITEVVELKKLVYLYILFYADHNDECREMALLSINSFQKDLDNSNELVRSMALRVMCSIKVVDIVPLQMMAVQKAAADSSPYVRKSAALAIAKVYSLDRSQREPLSEIISLLIGDHSTLVVASAMAAFVEVCPRNCGFSQCLACDSACHKLCCFHNHVSLVNSRRPNTIPQTGSSTATSASCARCSRTSTSGARQSPWKS